MSTTSFKEYILGWVCAKEFILIQQPRGILVTLDSDEEYQHINTLTQDKDEYCLVRNKPSFISSILSTSDDAKTEFYIYDKYIVDFLNKDTLNFTLYFKRGFFDAIGFIELENYITCYLPGNTGLTYFKDEIIKYNAKYNTTTDQWIWEESNGIDFICALYDVSLRGKPTEEYYLKSNLAKIDEAKQINLEGIPKFIYYKIRDNAVSPGKQYTTQPGFSISICEKVDEKNDIHYYATGLQFSCEYGYYLQIYGENLYEYGYMLANPFSVIKPGEENLELIIPLIKLNPDVPDLTLPMHVVNIIPTKLNLVELYELE